MTVLGHLRHFGSGLATSGLPPHYGHGSALRQLTLRAKSGPTRPVA